MLGLGQNSSIDSPPVTTPDATGSTVMRLDADGTPQSFFFSPYPAKDFALNSAGSVLIAAELPSDTFGGFTLPRPNGQNIAAMLRLKADLTPDLARSVSGLKGTEFDSPTRVALSDNGDALLAGNFFGTNVVFGPLVSKTTFSGGAFLAKLGTPPLPAIKANFSAGKLTLSWPGNSNWVLERVQALGATFAAFPYTTRTNPADASIIVDLPVEQNTAFFRLRKQ